MFSEPTPVFIFRCSANWKRYGATLVKNGTNLPSDTCMGGHWSFVESYRISDADRPNARPQDDAMRANLASQGWSIWDAAATAPIVAAAR